MFSILYMSTTSLFFVFFSFQLFLILSFYVYALRSCKTSFHNPNGIFFHSVFCLVSVLFHFVFVLFLSDDELKVKNKNKMRYVTSFINYSILFYGNLIFALNYIRMRLFCLQSQLNFSLRDEICYAMRMRWDEFFGTDLRECTLQLKSN